MKRLIVPPEYEANLVSQWNRWNHEWANWHAVEPPEWEATAGKT